jgi:hypothetical protein
MSPARLRVGQVPQARVVVLEPEAVADELVTPDVLGIAIGPFDLDEVVEVLERRVSGADLQPSRRMS